MSPRIYSSSDAAVPVYYTGQTWSVFNSSRVRTQNVTLTGGGDFAFLEWGGAGANVYDGVVLERQSDDVADIIRDVRRANKRHNKHEEEQEDTDVDVDVDVEVDVDVVARGHLLSSNCDAFHSFSTAEGPQILRATMGHQGDDFLNFHSRALIVLDIFSTEEEEEEEQEEQEALLIDFGDVPPLRYTGLSLAHSMRSFSAAKVGDSLRT